jgi:catechol-2,3-dioxygenase
MPQTIPMQEIQDDKGAQIICPTLHHTGHVTARKQEMMRWYYNVLGQQDTVQAEPPAAPWDITWTTNDWAHHRMSLGAMPGIDLEHHPSAPGVGHLAWEYESIDDLLESWERIKGLGIEPQFCVNHLITFAFYYRDPDYNLVELLCDAWDDHAKSYEVWTSDPRAAANPPGIPVDPAKLLAARRDGMSLDDLRDRSYAGEFKPDSEETNITHDFGDEKMAQSWKDAGRS